MRLVRNILTNQYRVFRYINLKLFVEHIINKYLILFKINFTSFAIFMFENTMNFSIFSISIKVLIAYNILIWSLNIHWVILADIRVGNEFGSIVASVSDFWFTSTNVKDEWSKVLEHFYCKDAGYLSIMICFTYIIIVDLIWGWIYMWIWIITQKYIIKERYLILLK